MHYQAATWCAYLHSHVQRCGTILVCSLHCSAMFQKKLHHMNVTFLQQVVN